MIRSRSDAPPIRRSAEPMPLRTFDNTTCSPWVSMGTCPISQAENPAAPTVAGWMAVEKADPPPAGAGPYTSRRLRNPKAEKIPAPVINEAISSRKGMPLAPETGFDPMPAAGPMRSEFPSVGVVDGVTDGMASAGKGPDGAAVDSVAGAGAVEDSSSAGATIDASVGVEVLVKLVVAVGPPGSGVSVEISMMVGVCVGVGRQVGRWLSVAVGVRPNVQGSVAVSVQLGLGVFGGTEVPVGTETVLVGTMAVFVGATDVLVGAMDVLVGGGGSVGMMTGVSVGSGGRGVCVGGLWVFGVLSSCPWTSPTPVNNEMQVVPITRMAARIARNAYFSRFRNCRCREGGLPSGVSSVERPD